jgi:hypothetical protein
MIRAGSLAGGGDGPDFAGNSALPERPARQRMNASRPTIYGIAKIAMLKTSPWAARIVERGSRARVDRQPRKAGRVCLSTVVTLDHSKICWRLAMDY